MKSRERGSISYKSLSKYNNDYWFGFWYLNCLGSVGSLCVCVHVYQHYIHLFDIFQNVMTSSQQ